MALVIPGLKDQFEVVSRIDSALDMTEEEFANYQKEYNPAALKLHQGQLPTIFVLRKVIPYDLKNQIISKQTKITQDEGKPKVEFDFGSTSLEVKNSLIDIKNGGEVLKMSRDPDGSASKDLMSLLQSVGIAQELWNAIKVVVQDGESKLKKK